MIFADTSFADLVPGIIGAVSGAIGAAGGSLTTLYFTIRTTKRKEAQEDKAQEELTLKGILARVDADRASMETKYNAQAARLDVVEKELADEKSERRAAELWISHLESTLTAAAIPFRPWAEFKSRNAVSPKP